MEDVLAVYERPYDPKRPLVCVDEVSKTLHDTPHGTLPMEAGRPSRQDYEYERNGTANIFMAVEPLIGRRTTFVTDQRTKQDFAELLPYLTMNILAQKRSCWSRTISTRIRRHVSMNGLNLQKPDDWHYDLNGTTHRSMALG